MNFYSKTEWNKRYSKYLPILIGRRREGREGRKRFSLTGVGGSLVIWLPGKWEGEMADADQFTRRRRQQDHVDGREYKERKGIQESWEHSRTEGIISFPGTWGIIEWQPVAGAKTEYHEGAEEGEIMVGVDGQRTCPKETLVGLWSLHRG